MPHVDEGILHAYLDGALDALNEAAADTRGTTRASVEAHFALCADCRALLESERAIRERAGAILADAGALEIDVPPFPALPVRRSRRVWPLAWAASVLVAVGAGWWGSELFRAQRLDSFEAAAHDTRSAPAASVAPPEAPLESRMDAASPVPEPTRASDETGDRAVSDVPRVARGESELRRQTTPTRNVAAEAPAEAQRSAVAARSGADERTAVTDSTRPVVESMRATTALSAAAPAAPGRQVTSPPVAMPGAAQGFVASDAADGQLRVFRGLVAEIDAGRIELTETTAESAADHPLLTIAGSASPRIELGRGIGFTVARLTQRTDAGVAVELITMRNATVALDALAVTGTPDVRQNMATQRQLQDQSRRIQRGEVRDAVVAAEKQLGTATHTVVSRGALSDGRQEVVLRLPDGVFVAVRAAVSAEEMQALLTRLSRVDGREQ